MTFPSLPGFPTHNTRGDPLNSFKKLTIEQSACAKRQNKI